MSFQAMTWATEQVLPAMQKIVLLMMANRTNHETGMCYPSLDLLAKECGMSKRAMVDQINRLESAGLVTVFRSKGDKGVNNVNKYRLNLHVKSGSFEAGNVAMGGDLEVNLHGGGSAGAALGVVQELHYGSAGAALGVVQELHHNQEIFNQEINLKQESKRAREKTENGFEKFWAEYPKKKSKDAAKKAWLKLNPDEQLQLAIIAAVVLAKTQDMDWLKENGQFIPYPASYLNGRRWEDEINAQKSPGDRTSQNQGFAKNTRGHYDTKKQQPSTNSDFAQKYGGLFKSPNNDG